MAARFASPARELAILALWAGYCLAITLIAFGGHFGLEVFWLYAPGQLALGLLSRRRAAVLAPLVLTILLGWLAFEAACPCHEDGAGFFYALWVIYFALPGVVLVTLGMVLARVLSPPAPGGRYGSPVRSPRRSR